MKNNKKIRIMSMQRVTNYGSFLQAYALKGLIESLGYNNTGFIDYSFEKDIIGTQSNIHHLGKILKLLHPITLFRKKRHLAIFRKKYKDYLIILGITDKKILNEKPDTLVIGSDEVFNCLQHYPVGYSRNLFGKGYEKSRVISYAASFGHVSLSELKYYGIDTEIGEMLSKFKSISVRDSNSKTIVKKITAREDILLHLDPVLVGNFNIADNKKKVDIENYIIVYAYTDRLTKLEQKRIKEFAKKHNKKIISLGFYQECADYNIIVDPLDVLTYFNYADYVITDTFHGSVFSIKVNTKFCTIVRSSNKNKLTSLLRTMKVEDQIAESLDDIERIYRKEIRFEECNKIIDEETKRAKKYLMENL